MWRLCVPYLEPMLGHLGGLDQVILEDIFCHWCWSAPDTHEMSINPVRAARITDTTLEKHSIFYICRPDSGGGRPGVGRGSTKRVGGRGRERI